MKAENIKKVAMYLRKSRRDRDTDILSKHRLQLTEIAEAKGYIITEYAEEAITGEKITVRPEMQKMLKDIKNKIFDAVLVVKYDRMSRGSQKDFGTILEILQLADCFVVTPDKIYDVQNDSDIMMLQMESVFANHEYREIKRRFQNGKKTGAKQGMFVNGKPPYPYESIREMALNSNGKDVLRSRIVVNPEKKEVYYKIKELYLSGGYGIKKIVIYLNDVEKVPSPNGGQWDVKTVHRLLLHDFHLGIIRYGKSIWKTDDDYRRFISGKRDDNEISVGYGDWEKTKTWDEHEKIQQIMQGNHKVPMRARMGSYPTSSLMYCKKCGYTMRYASGRKEKTTGKTYDFLRCGHLDLLGNKCTQRGIKMTEEFYDALYNRISSSYLNPELWIKTHIDETKISEYRADITNLKKELEEQDEVYKRINSAFKKGIYSEKQFGEEKAELEAIKTKIIHQIDKKEGFVISATKLSREEVDTKIKIFKKNWKKATTNEEKNILLKTVVSRILYDRDGSNITFEIEYR